MITRTIRCVFEWHEPKYTPLLTPLFRIHLAVSGFSFYFFIFLFNITKNDSDFDFTIVFLLRFAEITVTLITYSTIHSSGFDYQKRTNSDSTSSLTDSLFYLVFITTVTLDLLFGLKVSWKSEFQSPRSFIFLNLPQNGSIFHLFFSTLTRKTNFNFFILLKFENLVRGLPLSSRRPRAEQR